MTQDRWTDCNAAGLQKYRFTCILTSKLRQKLRARLEEMEQSITEEEQIVEKMNEDKMINALNSNVELGCLQTHFDKVGWHQLFEKYI